MSEPASPRISASPPLPVPGTTATTLHAAPGAGEPLTPEERRIILDQLDDVYGRLKTIPTSDSPIRHIHTHPHLAAEGIASRLLALDGPIGVGKTTLCEDLLSELQTQDEAKDHRLVVEPVLNEVLDMFYADPDDMADRFQLLQCCLCTSSARLALIESAYNECPGTVLLDRSPLGNLSFALVHYLGKRIPEKGFRVYKATLASTGPLCLPTTVFLHASPEIVNERIRKRRMQTDPSRACESGIPLSYLQRLDAVMLLVAAYAAAKGLSRVHFVDWTRFGTTSSVLATARSTECAQPDLEAVRAVTSQAEMLTLLGLPSKTAETQTTEQHVVTPHATKQDLKDETIEIEVAV